MVKELIERVTEFGALATGSPTHILYPVVSRDCFSKGFYLLLRAVSEGQLIAFSLSADPSARVLTGFCDSTDLIVILEGND